MKTKINDDLTLYFTPLYPKTSTIVSNKTYDAILGIGGNIGDVQKRFHKLYLALQSNHRFDIIQTSPLLKNPPFGYLEQDDFLNGLIHIKTNLPPFVLLKEMQRYENRFGRVRSFQDAPRTLDIDIIFMRKGYEKIYLNTPILTIPHHGWQDRESVKIPFNFLNYLF
jgi:2-amino-4-hydroxy-6-hydroxymethyldihydropteridine diphosphokinase